MIYGLKQGSLIFLLHVSLKKKKTWSAKPGKSTFYAISADQFSLDTNQNVIHLCIYFFKWHEPGYLTGLQVMLILFLNIKYIQLTINIVLIINSYL